MAIFQHIRVVPWNVREWLARRDELNRDRQANAIAIARSRDDACQICGLHGHDADSCDDVKDW